jgi:hypothetical protein
VEVIDPDVQTYNRRKMFLQMLFGSNQGYFCIAYIDKARNPKSFREEYFYFPRDVERALELINNIYGGHNVWICPHLFSQAKRKKEFVSVVPSAWADLDACPPEKLLVEPTITIESSPGRYQGLWLFEKEVSPDDAENLSQRIAYRHADEGADRSGWDLTQLLRMPFTYNYKYGSSPIVKIIEANKRRYRLSDFEEYPETNKYIVVDQEMPDVSNIDGTKLLDDNRAKISPTIWKLFQERPTETSWSESLWKLETMLFEAGFGAEQVFAIAQEAACNKYSRDNTSITMLWKDVCRAEAHVATMAPVSVEKATNPSKPLLSDEERKQIEGTRTIIEKYIDWAKALGDAAPQYHQAGAFILLSSLLAGSVQLPTSFGTVKPNLWFMILADTTLTRKSTAMDIAMDLLAEIDDDALMATDGSIEGLLTSLSTRPGKPSVFLRDEFSGLLEMIVKKDYYAGMPELLTKLYDGKMQKRILRKESIDVRDPVLILFAGGIKNKTQEILTYEQVSSGFMPRFIFITAESDVNRVRPLGPPTSRDEGNKQAILDELRDLYNHYRTTTTMTVKDSKVSYEVQKKFDARLTDDAWIRYNQLETQLLEEGVGSKMPEIMTPVYDRLSKSILKAAVLIAAARTKAEDILVEEIDIIRAISYGTLWKEYAEEVMRNIGRSKSEKQLDNVYKYIRQHPGCSRSSVMQYHRLQSRDASMILDTLEQRGLILRSKQGRGETLTPLVIERVTA